MTPPPSRPIPVHNRPASGAAAKQTEPSLRQSRPTPHFTVFVRLPFARHGFVDPPLVEWDASKENALWKILSQAAGGSVDNWQKLADKFNVSLPFLLQQSAWLYERQLSQVRAQMRKVGHANTSKANSPLPGSASGSTATAQSMRRGGSGDAGGLPLSRPLPTGMLTIAGPSGLPARAREAHAARGVGSVPLTPNKPQPPPLSRNSSTSTTAQPGQGVPVSPRPSRSFQRRPSYAGANKVEATMRPQVNSARDETAVDERSIKEDSSEDRSSSDSSAGALRSQKLKRSPAMVSSKARSNLFGDDVDAADDDEDDDAPAFLPFSVPESASKEAGTRAASRPRPLQTEGRRQRRSAAQSSDPSQAASFSPTAHSSASSGSSHAVARPEGAPGQRAGPLSPRRAAELAAQSPRRRATVEGGSDGTPSMGSSFSDLDDTSVTQSALEEALLSNMQRGGVTSRMSTISQALRSRYL